MSGALIHFDVGGRSLITTLEVNSVQAEFRKANEAGHFANIRLADGTYARINPARVTFVSENTQ